MFDKRGRKGGGRRGLITQNRATRIGREHAEWALDDMGWRLGRSGIAG
jgi:hypothetical protein